MKVHGGECNDNRGRPCSAEHMYYCPGCSKKYITDGSTHSQDVASGKVYASPSYPCCSPTCLATANKRGEWSSMAHRTMSKPGELKLSEPVPEPNVVNTADAVKGA